MQISLNGTAIEDRVEMDGFDISDSIRDPDSSFFDLVLPPSESLDPSGTDEVIITDNSGTRLYAGTIVSVKKTLRPSNAVEYRVECKGRQYGLTRYDVVEKYSGRTAEDIIKNELVPEYAPSYTTNNVDADVNIESIAFTHQTLKEALDRMAQKINHVWYVDYNKDIHFYVSPTG